MTVVPKPRPKAAVPVTDPAGADTAAASPPAAKHREAREASGLAPGPSSAINDRVHRTAASRSSTRKETADRLRFVWLIVIPLIAILFQVYVPRFIGFLPYLELPLLITVHFALSRRSPIPSVFYGMSIGLVQDSLSHQPIGMFGIVKTLVGYFAASVSQRFDVENPMVTFILSFFFYFFHQFFYWVLARALLGAAR